jgi:hypothetical protein
MKAINETRTWHVGRCPRCLIPRGAVEVGEGERMGRNVLIDAGYRMSVEPGPISFPPHAKECK